MNRFKAKTIKNQRNTHILFDYHANYADRVIEERSPYMVENWKSSSHSPEAHIYAIKKIFKKDIRFKKYELDPELKKFIKGKRIAFVGPSSSIKELGLGTKIDSYDLVFRANQHYELPEEETEDYGQKTDAIITCLNQTTFTELNSNLDFIDKIKYIIGGNLLLWDRESVEENLESVDTNSHLPTDGEILAIDKEVGTICNTGFMGIILLLRYPIKELFIAGVDFYDFGEAVGKENVYSSSYEESSNRYHGDLRLDIHDQESQMNYFSRVLEKYDNISLDPILDEYFND